MTTAIPVVWVSRHLERTDPFPVTARGYWDQGMLEALFAGELWRTPGQRSFAHQVNFAELPPGSGAVVVLPARHHASRSDVDWLNARLAPLPWVLLMLTGDEEGSFRRHEIEHPNIAMWVQTPATDLRLDVRPIRQRPIGDGWPASCPSEIARRPIEKPLAWFFAGQVTHEERRDCRDALNTRLATHADGHATFTQGFTQGMPQEIYFSGLAAAKIAPCPGGPVTPDTFRVFEALEAGCLPVVRYHPYWDGLLGPVHPLHQIREWVSFSAACDSLLSGWPANANRAGAWWLGCKRRMAEWLSDDLDQLGAPAAEPSADDQVTVLIPTSVIPSHPSTAVIEETIASVRAQLPTAEILILVDGVPDHLEERQADYDEYVRRLVFLCSRRWRNVLPVLSGRHAHQSGLLRQALPLVRTPTVLFVEHDTPLVGPIDWDGIVGAVVAGDANVVRFHHEAAVHPEHAHLMLDRDPRPVGPAGVPMLRCAQWSSRPHLAATEFYRSLLASYFAPEAVTFTEDVLNGVLESAWLDRGEPGWAPWSLWIYAPAEPGPVGGIKRSTHLDGRAQQPKEECVFAYPGRTPPGAPQPTERLAGALL